MAPIIKKTTTAISINAPIIPVPVLITIPPVEDFT